MNLVLRILTDKKSRSEALMNRRLAKIRAWAVCFAIATTAVTAAAQPANPARCAGPLPFPVNAANQVAAKDMQKLFAGRTMQYLRRWRGAQPAPSQTSRGPPAAPLFERIFTTDYRRDGSLLARCEERPEGSGTTFRACEHFTPEASGSTENGTWRIDGGLLCWVNSRIRNAEEVCVSVHHQDGRYAAKLARGPWTCKEGEFLFK
jgi:hypothetical protein